MKFSLKTLAAAVTLAVAAAGANAAIDAGASGNGELFFNVWDANGSYTLDLNVSIDSFESALAASGAFSQLWSDTKLVSFLGTADQTSLQWNVVAADGDGVARLLTTFSTLGSSNIRNNAGTNAVGTIGQFATAVNTELAAGADSVIVTNVNPAYAGADSFGNKINNGLNFSNSGTLATDSYADGLSFLRATMANSTSARSVYNVYADGADSVKVWLDGSGLHMSSVAAVPEPSEYALLLAGLGMIGFMARRNKRA
ncbi:PEP-CTERM sorting domain-containing protein [Ferribacterium limneticum]|uniref:PEP-CTERM sorting domain-containing protein n=1 Tax=Ferribacterium limneticum TaxID=76259 RepID=UPI001CF9AEC8|nr:PEP-CTERM sorting domain-containing protein [Ferribacterium limneticum]